ncbi:unnamed protein product [Acanthoscelides obtectus]|uniref:Mos1 transposase HTH domain-containing protein n=1 Tax=Acanthoscelides obtectus TaxID=200917 RepID=A0A9P0P757_ACAOB|nr:unnamed protein product [Acanthoscelides obtectus]CAK1635777.1 hypothetical protein AOBTE_LOCUS9493 [Acanthoscelides obtectus]
MELNREHFHAIIYYNFQRQLSQQECLAELLSVFDNKAPHQSTISRWYGKFERGRVSLSDDPRVGAPKTAVTQENVVAVRKLIIEDRHVTYREIEASLKLVSQQKAARVNWCQKTLDRFNSGNSKNVYSFVSGDESWIYCEEKPTKVIRSRSVSKNIVATFMSKAGHIATIALNEQRIVTADCPDLSPNDFFACPNIENRLRGQRFLSPEEAVDAFKSDVLDPSANEWNKCFENWFERMQVCINLRGECFEKQ